jgi:hypothetical protein
MPVYWGAGAGGDGDRPFRAGTATVVAFRSGHYLAHDPLRRGFGLFQSPNNHTIITSAPRHRSGGASGMLGTARLGQSTGAALVALMFNLAGQNGNHVALLTAGALATLAAIVSGLRVTQPRVQA